MAEASENVTVSGVVKSVNRKNSGFTLVEKPDEWLNYSSYAKIDENAKAARGDRVKVVVNANNWIQSLDIIERAAPAQQSSSSSSSGGSGAQSSSRPSGEMNRRPTDESLSIGRQSALKSAVEFCGFMPSVQTDEEALQRAELVIQVSTIFAKFVNEPIVRSALSRSGRFPEAAQASSTPEEAQQAASAPGASVAPPVQAQGQSAPQPAPAPQPSAIQPVPITATFCARDGRPIVEGIEWSGGEKWDAERMISYTREQYGEPLCADHFRGELQKQREQAKQAASAAGVTQGV